MGVNYGSDKLGFLTTVKVGSRVRLKMKVLSVDERPDGSLLVKNELATWRKVVVKAGIGQ